MKVISLKNLHISCGWFDSSVSFGDPGFEERETLATFQENQKKCSPTAKKKVKYSGFFKVTENRQTLSLFSS